MLAALAVAAGTASGGGAQAAEPGCPGSGSPNPSVIWCDGFEDTDLGPGGTIGEKYYEWDGDDGDLIRVPYEHAEGSQALRFLWQAGEVGAGQMILNFGRNPLGSQARSSEDFREIYWRLYVKHQTGFQGHPSKLTRLTSFATGDWAQSMIAHIWADDSDPAYLAMDPVSGTDSAGNLQTTKWNDFDNFNWLGLRKGTTPIDPGRWYCVEGHVALDNGSAADGVFEFWIDDALQARRTDLAFMHGWSDYGLNSLFFESYWGPGSPAEQERYMDAIVVSTERIGCIGGADLTPPDPPTGVAVEAAE